MLDRGKRFRLVSTSSFHKQLQFAMMFHSLLVCVAGSWAMGDEKVAEVVLRRMGVVGDVH